MLAAVQLLPASGAPFEDASTNSTVDESSGEEGERVETSPLPKTSNIFSMWETIIEPMKGHQKEFEEEFQGNVDYLFLNNYKRPSFPVKCPESNFTREACLLRLVQGLQAYTVLLKLVKKEYPNSLTLPEVSRLQQLMTLIKERMKNSKRVTVLTSSQEEQLLKELDNMDDFRRKMTAHSILHYLRIFLIDGKRSLCKWEMQRRRKTGTNGAYFGCQSL
ncbi:interleukin-6-like [Melanotaenia boesemani]|uniref:interleukin-6-like n=1 Tax=Melanotaenia boesemani TaxID=1250792 RepID=UPI001C053502|nr:interleukin-6-like [Melanotaenia boesemani]